MPPTAGVYDTNTSSHAVASKPLIFPDIALVLPNSGSIARDMLANERNFLTFFRLSCTLIVLGFTIMLKFRLPDNHDHIPGDDEDWFSDSVRTHVGYCFIATGFISLFVSVGKYFKTQLLLASRVNSIRFGWGMFPVVAIIFCLTCVIMVLTYSDSYIFHS